MNFYVAAFSFKFDYERSTLYQIFSNSVTRTVNSLDSDSKPRLAPFSTFEHFWEQEREICMKLAGMPYVSNYNKFSKAWYLNPIISNESSIKEVVLCYCSSGTPLNCNSLIMPIFKKLFSFQLHSRGWEKMRKAKRGK